MTQPSSLCRLLRMTAGILLLLFAFSSLRAADKPSREIILNTSIRPNNLDIYLFNKPGSAPRPLTTDPALDYNPVFSPDGRWVVFCSERRGNPDLYALDLQHEGPLRLLTDSDAMEDAPAFSPDGRTLAFISTRDGKADIFVMPFRPEESGASTLASNLTQRHRTSGQPKSAGQIVSWPSVGNFNPAFSPDGQSIAFTSDRDGFPWRIGSQTGASGDIYVMDADGSNLKRLTDTSGWDGSPEWSADGQTILFYSDRAGNLGIWRMDADGSRQQPLSPANRRALSPTAMGDGRVAFAVLNGQRWQIMSTAADGSDLRPESDNERSYWSPSVDRNSGRLVCHGAGPVERGSTVGGTFPHDHPGTWLVAGSRSSFRLPDREVQRIVGRGFWSALSADGHAVAGIDFLVNEQNTRLVTFRLDGTEVREIFRSKISLIQDYVLQKLQFQRIWCPAWSPDGRWIAFAYGEPFGKPEDACDIWKVRSDGTGIVNLTGDSKANDALPSFSGDSRQIAFRSGRDGNEEIYAMNADGSNLRRITNDPATDTMPAFSPDGHQIAFSSARDGDYELYVVQLTTDGMPGATRRLTESLGHDVHPFFSPDGKWLAFVSARGGMNDEYPLIRESRPFGGAQPYGEIYALRLADGHVERLTQNKFTDGIPIWSRLVD